MTHKNASTGIVAHQGYYDLLMPRSKYPKCFCTEEDIRIAEEIREFVQKEMMPRRHDFEGGYHRDRDLAKKACNEIYQKLWQLGVCRSIIPEKYGGLGLGRVAKGMVDEELCRADIGVGTAPSMLHWMASFMLAAGRDDLLEELKHYWEGDDAYHLGIWFTEPQGGGNLEDPAFEGRYFRTTARLDGDEWVINGHKLWPRSAPAQEWVSDYTKGCMGYCVLAKDDAYGSLESIGIYYIPPDAKGLEFSAPFDKMGMCYADENREIWLDDVRLPRRYRIDTKPGEGGRMLRNQIIASGRLSSSFKLCGLASAVLEIGLDYTAQREIAGKPVREHSYFASILGECFRRLEAARSMCLSVAWQADHAEEYGPLHSPQFLAKASSTRCNAGWAAEFITNRVMELIGSNGYTYDYHVEKYMRDYKIAVMWLGGRQRDTLDISQGLYGIYKWPGQEDWERSGYKNVVDGWSPPTIDEVYDRGRPR